MIETIEKMEEEFEIKKTELKQMKKLEDRIKDFEREVDDNHLEIARLKNQLEKKR